MWTFAAYGLVRWAFVESWKDSIKRNVSSTVNVTSEDAYEFLRQSGAARRMVNGQSFNIEPREQCQRIEQVLEYFARVRESLERCGIINTTVIKSVAADESLVIPSNVIRITPVVNEPGSVIDIRHLHGYQNHRNPQDTADPAMSDSLACSAPTFNAETGITALQDISDVFSHLKHPKPAPSHPLDQYDDVYSAGVTHPCIWWNGSLVPLEPGFRPLLQHSAPDLNNHDTIHGTNESSGGTADASDTRVNEQTSGGTLDLDLDLDLDLQLDLDASTMMTEDSSTLSTRDAVTLEENQNISQRLSLGNPNDSYMLSSTRNSSEKTDKPSLKVHSSSPKHQ